MSIFPREAGQYDWAQLSLNKYVEEYEGKTEWELRTTIRKDTMQRVRSGLTSSKVVFMRKPKVFEITIRQLNDTLSAINSKCPYHMNSYKVIKAIDSFIGGFNSGAVAYLIYGPSEKDYETGKHEQNVKRIIFCLRKENLLIVDKKKFCKLPVWKYFYAEVQKLHADNKFLERKDILWW